MKITINTSAAKIKNAVVLASKFVNKAGDYSNQVILSGNENELTVKASNNMEAILVKDIHFTCTDMTIDSFKEIAVDSVKLTKVLQIAKSENVSLKLDENFITVISGSSKIKVERFVEVQKISLNTNDDMKELVIGQELSGMLDKAYHAIDKDSSRIELSGANLIVKNNKTIVAATDTKSLAVISKNIKSNNDLNIIIPKIGIKTIVGLFGKASIVAKVDDFKLLMESKNVNYSVKLINGKFPEWQKIVPKEEQQTVVLNKKLFTSMLEEASIFNNEIIIKINSNKIEMKDFEDNTSITEEYESNIHTDVKFAINSKMFLEFLKTVSQDEIKLGFNDTNLPLVLSVDEEHKEICMPIAFSEEIGDINSENVA